MDTEVYRQCQTLAKEISAWKIAAQRWRSLAKRLMESERIRFRGIVGDQVWERDLIVAPTKKWERMLQTDVGLRVWSTCPFGPLTLALSPPPVILLATEIDGR